MTRKDYIIIAKALREAWDATGNETMQGHEGVLRATVEIADTLAADNPLFNRERFLEACGQ